MRILFSLTCIVMAISAPCGAVVASQWVYSPLQECLKAKDKGVFVGSLRSTVNINTGGLVVTLNGFRSRCDIQQYRFILGNRVYDLHYPTGGGNPASDCRKLADNGAAFCDHRPLKDAGIPPRAFIPN